MVWFQVKFATFPDLLGFISSCYSTTPLQRIYDDPAVCYENEYVANIFVFQRSPFAARLAVL